MTYMLAFITQYYKNETPESSTRTLYRTEPKGRMGIS
jgi:hypothetical protein